MKLALSPMATLTHEALRILIHRYGDPDEYFSEMIHAPSLLSGGQFEKYYIRMGPVPEKIVWQLTGGDAGPLERAAAMLIRLGGIGLDLNMGCSAPDIARFGAGIAWMLKPAQETADLVRRVRHVIDDFPEKSPAKPFRLSVKLRLGVDENYSRLLDFCRMLAEEGVELIILHPRIKSDKYGRPARREYVGRLSGDLAIPVYGNGDVDSAQDALSFVSSFPCAGLMIGRAAIRMPWIFRDIRLAESFACGDSVSVTAAASAAERATATETTAVAIDHLEVGNFFLKTLKVSQPDEFQLSRARRFFYYYCDNFSFAHHIKMRIQNAKSPEDIGALLEEYFLSVPHDRYLV